MIEYLYDAIRATSGQPIGITAKLTKEEGEIIETPCELHLFDDDGMIAAAPGIHLGEGVWQFEIAAEDTEGRTGRYWYCIGNEGQSLCFKKPLYLV